MLSRTVPVFGLVLVCLIAAASGCGDDSGSGGGGDDAGATTATTGGSTCYSVPVNDQNDGSSACGPEICPGGEHCVSDVGICDPGCTSELNCPEGQTCDLSNAPNGVGLCRKPRADEATPCGTTGTCADRCEARASACGAPAAQADQACAALCPGLTEDQIECLETTSCEDLEALQMGQAVCGIQGGE